MIDVRARVLPRVNNIGRKFTEVLYEGTRDGVPFRACSRYWYDITDSPQQRAVEEQQFTKRQERLKIVVDPRGRLVYTPV